VKGEDQVLELLSWGRPGSGSDHILFFSIATPDVRSPGHGVTPQEKESHDSGWRPRILFHDRHYLDGGYMTGVPVSGTNSCPAITDNVIPVM
jgi:hypothetical protein